MVDEIQDILGPDGLLARQIPGFAFRAQQLEMAREVAAALADAELLITEAGTGTGKTFAYLTPALMSGRKVIVSTGTKNLQDQLFNRDLPKIRDILALPVRTALLKGRANYLCPHRLDLALGEGRFRSKELIGHLMDVRDWSGKTRSGDIAEIDAIPEDSLIWPHVTSNTDNCLGQDCPAYKDCHLAEARKRAQEADLVVVNHHLLCADFALKDEGFGELLPSADAFIIDEAHQLPEVASNFFGTVVSGRQLLDLARDVKTEYQNEAGDLKAIPEQADQLEKAARDLRLAFGVETRRGPWAEIQNNQGVNDSIADTREQLAALSDLLERVRERGKGLESCADRCLGMVEDLANICDPADDEDIRWFETLTHSFRLNRTPLEIADTFRAQMQRRRAAWIFTSATLAVGKSFRHFQAHMGLENARTAQWESPFDYPNQALWFVPRGLPQPRESHYTEEAVNRIIRPVVQASRGRAFLLFTSHRALRAAAEMLHDTIDYPILVQGDAPKATLLERFSSAGNAVLLGASSFWEGVDVRGAALSVVVIDKLPFASPGDPVLQARIDALKKRGGNPFMEYQVPQAAIALKQGAGRLIRDVTDRGVLVICDPRLLKRGYGQTFLDSMPAMARTRDIEDVKRFFAEERKADSN